jgi:DNA repair photolyase
VAPPGELRWPLAPGARTGGGTDDPAGEEGQGALFEGVERHVGRGEYRGMEFLHVNARRIVNEVPAASRVPFRFTINAYRGCSHACTYCLAPATPVLMADGHTRPISALRVGDAVVGTAPDRRRRRLVATVVRAHWETVETAYRVTLEDGTALVAGGDHRFLTEAGWGYVTAAEKVEGHRPHLTTSSALLGPGEPERAGADSGAVLGRTVEGGAGRRVVAVEALGARMPMYDITTGTGDFVADGVVSHNCFARPTHEFLGLNAGDDFERRIVVKVNAVERLRAELAPSRWAGHHIAMGTNTDPYQRCEAKYRLTRGIVGELVRAANPFSVLTKSSLVLRDLDVLAEAARAGLVRVNFSIGTLDDEVWKLTEPGTPHPRRRVEAMARLVEAGVPCGVLVAPVLPGLSDGPGSLEEVVRACVAAGAASVTPILLHLRPGVREHYVAWLAGARPDLVAECERLYPRAYAPKARQEALARYVADLVARHGGHPPSPGSRRSAPRPRPVGGRPAAGAGRTVPHQLGLGL